jgi:NodT family efflux transporter outer membrane factor (OMF) lipoprotein
MAVSSLQSPRPALPSRIGVAVVSAIGIAGCTLGPNYTRPPLPSHVWHAPLEGGLSASPSDPAVLASWWQQLDDPLLTDLVATADGGNLDLVAARQHVREVQSQRAVAQAALYPSVRARVEAIPVNSSSSKGLTGFEAVWTPDVFGKLHRTIEAATADAAVGEESRHDVEVSVGAEVAQAYVDVRSLQSRLAIAQSDLDSQTESLDLARWRAQAGLTTVLDVDQARSNVEQTRAQMPTLRAGLEQAKNRLAVLLGREPGSIDELIAEVRPIPRPPTEVAIGVPTDTLERRPDVRRAERALAAETARIGAAKADEYPSFSFTGQVGIDAISPATFTHPAAIAGVVAANAVQVLFDHGAIRAKVRAQKAVRAQALAHFESTVLHALEEVENDIAAYGEEQSRAAALQTAAEAAERAATYSRERYRSGLIDFQIVLDADRSLHSIQDQLAVSRGQVVSDLIALYRSLGGGWTTGEGAKS